MRKLFLTFLATGVVLVASAQNLPKPSPHGEVEQTVGVTDIEIEYSRPSANGRIIYGGLVPYDVVWRFGANASTQIETNGPLTFENGILEAGSYAMFALPKKDGDWEIIFNKDSKQGGISAYTEAEDVLRVKGKTSDNSFTETFTIGFDKLTHKAGTIIALWENLKVEIPFTVNSEEMSKANIDEAIAKVEDLDKVYNNAAGYYFNILGDYKTALDYADKSITKKEGYGNLFTKARALEKLGNKAEAIKIAQKALVLAKAADAKGYADFISGNLESWSK